MPSFVITSRSEAILEIASSLTLFAPRDDRKSTLATRDNLPFVIATSVVVTITTGGSNLAMKYYPSVIASEAQAERSNPCREALARAVAISDRHTPSTL